MTAVATREPWEAYAEATRAPHFADWCERHCVQSIDRFDGRPLILEPWQRRIMAEALAEEAEDETYWRTVVLVIPKKNGKTSMLAAYALYHLLEDDGSPEILLAAATDKQAGRLFDTAVRFVKSDAWLAAHLVIREHEGQIARADGFGTLYRISGDSGAVAGYNPSLVVADELAEWTTPRRRRTWGDVATAGRMARRHAHVFVISTAGEPTERVGGILGQLIDRNELDGDTERVHRALTISRNHRAKTLVYNYDANTHDPADLDAIRAANPAAWIDSRTLVELAASPDLTPGKFLQLHGCVWAASEAGYLTLEEWRGLARPGVLGDREEVLLGFRGAEGCALVACRRADGRLFSLGVWEHDIDADEIDATMADTLERQRVVALFACYTPERASLVDGWGHILGRRRATGVPIDRPSARTAEITERFRADARAALVTHDGDRRVAGHMVAAQLARQRNLPYLTTDVRRGHPIDAAFACVLAWEARAQHGPGQPRDGYAFL